MVDQTFKCFVYGTLRQGEYNMISWDGMEDVAPRLAKTRGNIYHVSPYHRIYPVAKFDQDGIIMGEVLAYPEWVWENIVRMEEGAGYELREVEVTYGDCSTEKVLAWHYKRDPIGPRIESGDWFDSRGWNGEGDDSPLLEERWYEE